MCATHVSDVGRDVSRLSYALRHGGARGPLRAARRALVRTLRVFTTDVTKLVAHTATPCGSAPTRPLTRLAVGGRKSGPGIGHPALRKVEFVLGDPDPVPLSTPKVVVDTTKGRRERLRAKYWTENLALDPRVVGTPVESTTARLVRGIKTGELDGPLPSDVNPAALGIESGPSQKAVGPSSHLPSHTVAEVVAAASGAYDDDPDGLPPMDTMLELDFMSRLYCGLPDNLEFVQKHAEPKGL